MAGCAADGRADARRGPEDGGRRQLRRKFSILHDDIAYNIVCCVIHMYIIFYYIIL